MATVFDPSISFDNEFFDFQISADGLTGWVDANSGRGYFLKANKQMTSGKFYWEIVWSGSVDSAGLADDIATNQNGGHYMFEDTGTEGRVSVKWPSDLSNHDVLLGAGFRPLVGDVLQFAADFDSNRFWVGINGTWANSGDPAAGTNFIYLQPSSWNPCVEFDEVGQSTQNATISPQTTTYSPPAGFSALDPPPPDIALPTFRYSLNVLGTYTGQVADQYALNAKDLRKGFLTDRWLQVADPVWTPVVTAVHYRLTLRDDGLTDLELPMSSFQSRVRQARPSFLSVIVPGILDHLDEINARINGELVVEMGTRKTDGTISVIEIARGNLQDVRYDRGPTSSTGTLTGRKTKTYSAPKTVQIGDVELVSNTSTNRIRCKVLNEVKPGDTVEAAGISFVVDLIQHIVSPQQAYMELSDG